MCGFCEHPEAYNRIRPLDNDDKDNKNNDEYCVYCGVLASARDNNNWPVCKNCYSG